MLLYRGLNNQLFRGNLKLIALFISFFMFYEVDAQTANPNMAVTNHFIYSTAVDGNYTYIGGSFTFVGENFTTIGGQSRNRIAKLSTSGTGAADATWDPSTSNSVNSIAISGSDIYFAGDFTITNGYARNFMVRINNTTGKVDPDWYPDVNNTVVSLVVNGSYVYAGGFFTVVKTSSNPVFRYHIARFPTTETGTADPTWDPVINGTIYSMVINGSDIYVGGNFTSVNSAPAVTRYNLAKLPLTSPATVDNMWNPNLDQIVYALGVSGTDLFVGGDFTTVNGSVTRNRLAKFPLTGNATVDAWDPNLNSDVQDIVISGTDIYVAGGFTTVNGSVTRNHLARFPLTGTATVDAWDPNLNNVAFALAVSGSDLYVGGGFTTVNGGTGRN